MRVLFDHPVPFVLTHGGFQIQIEQTAKALRQIGVDVEFLRWWDDRQKGDIIHYFGRPPVMYIAWAQGQGFRVVVADLLTELGSRSRRIRLAQKLTMRIVRRVLPGSFQSRLAWDSYQKADAAIALTAWEGTLLQQMFDVPPEKVRVVPNGVEEVFRNAPARERTPWLICTATITERKRVLELAEAAVMAQTPVWIVGKPYFSTDAYGQRFEQLARANPRWIRYEGAIQDRKVMAEAYRSARGFVLLSAMESLSLSALEAAACECPLLLSDLPWARTVFGDNATYCAVTSVSETAKHLRQFYDAAPTAPRAPKPLTWAQVAEQFRAVYEGLLRTSR
jgi:glycosyltransferase involved in cell wall biosynthesis